MSRTRKPHARPRNTDDRRPITWCTSCRLSTYATRKAAKDAAKVHKPGQPHRAFPCPVAPGYFHHKPTPTQTEENP